MITWIGLCAGEIWNYLDGKKGEAVLKNVVSEIKAPQETIFMALGWLAREGHISMTDLEPESTIQLKTYFPEMR